MQSLALGGLRVLRGEEQAKQFVKVEKLNKMRWMAFLNCEKWRDAVLFMPGTRYLRVRKA